MPLFTTSNRSCHRTSRDDIPGHGCPFFLLATHANPLTLSVSRDASSNSTLGAPNILDPVSNNLGPSSLRQFVKFRMWEQCLWSCQWQQLFDRHIMPAFGHRRSFNRLRSNRGYRLISAPRPPLFHELSDLSMLTSKSALLLRPVPYLDGRRKISTQITLPR